MALIDLAPSLQPGDPAPSFELPAVNREGTVSLSDYRGKSPLLLGLFRGLYCPLCRRAIAQMAQSRGKLVAMGVEALAVVASKLDHARLYFRFHPTPLSLAADPAMTVLRAYRVPKPQVTPELLKGYQTTRVDPIGELPAPVPITDIAMTLNQIDGYELSEADHSDLRQQWQWDSSTQFMGRFLIDRDGIVRWVDIECAREGLGAWGRFSNDDALWAAVRAL